MKQLIFLVMAVFFVGCSGSAIKEQKFLGVNGSPKSIKDTKYEAVEKFGEVIEQDVDEVLCYEFDKHGFVQKMVYYNSDGDVNFSVTNTFENGKCIENKSYQKYNDLTTTSTLKNRTSKSEIWESTTSDGKTTTQYSEIENLKTTMIVKDSDDNAVSKVELIRDNKGNIVEYKVYNEEKVVYWYKSTFNEKSQEVERKMLSGYDEGIYTYKYDSFDKKRNWTKKVEYKDGEIESLTIREITY